MSFARLNALKKFVWTPHGMEAQRNPQTLADKWVRYQDVDALVRAASPPVPPNVQQPCSVPSPSDGGRCWFPKGHNGLHDFEQLERTADKVRAAGVVRSAGPPQEK